MKKIIYASALLAAFMLTGCSDDDNNNDNTNTDSYYTIVNNGNGGVTSINDANDTDLLEIAQAIPSVSGDEYPAYTPVLFFFNDKILLSSITKDSFVVKENGKQVTGTISVNEAANGYAILTFTPQNVFKGGAQISVKLTTGLQDDGGQPLLNDVEFDYTTFTSPATNISGNTGFENGTNGLVFIGDGNVLTGEQGCMSPFEGSSFGAITSGNQLISANDAIGGTSSALIMGPFDSSASSLSFSYNFLSAEFLEYVGSEYDDSFMAVVVGQNGAHAEFITSVNTIGENVTQCSGFPGMPDEGDEYAGFTGWVNKQLSFGNITGPVYVIFIATDVSDTIYSTVVGVDNVVVN